MREKENRVTVPGANTTGGQGTRFQEHGIQNSVLGTGETEKSG